MSAAEFNLWCMGMGLTFVERIEGHTKTLKLVAPEGVLAWTEFSDIRANELSAVRWLRRKAREATVRK